LIDRRKVHIRVIVPNKKGQVSSRALFLQTQDREKTGDRVREIEEASLVSLLVIFTIPEQLFFFGLLDAVFI
jgi:hypothetical protein